MIWVREKFGRGNIMLGEINYLKLYGLKELVVIGKAVSAVIVGVFLDVILRAYPESHQRHCHPT